MASGAKKSLYVFVSSIMGILLFLILHRVVFFVWLLLQISNYNAFGTNISYIELLAIEYSSLIIVLFLGSWYGIWVGEYWYEKVYVVENHKGLFGHLASKYLAPKNNIVSLTEKIEALSKKVEHESEDINKLTVSLSEVSPKKRNVRVVKSPVRRKLVSKKVNI